MNELVLQIIRELRTINETLGNLVATINRLTGDVEHRYLDTKGD